MAAWRVGRTGRTPHRRWLHQAGLGLLAGLLMWMAVDLLRGGRDWSVSWASGQPLHEVVGPALLSSLSRWVPVWCGVLLASRSLALADGPWAQRTRRWIASTGGIPVFLAGYLLIIVVNRVVWAGVQRGISPPAWFALPVGDGQWQGAKWVFSLMVLAVGDGILAQSVSRLRTAVERLQCEPFFLAWELNAGQGQRVLRRHLRGPLILNALLLLPSLAGASLVLEPLFLEPGLGLLLIRSLEVRDFPVLATLWVSGLAGGFAVQAAVERLSALQEEGGIAPWDGSLETSRFAGPSASVAAANGGEHSAGRRHR